MGRKKEPFKYVTDRQAELVIANHSPSSVPCSKTFPPNGYYFQRRLERERKHEQFLKDVNLIVKYERRKKMKMLLADLGPTYLENLRIESTPYLKVA